LTHKDIWHIMKSRFKNNMKLRNIIPPPIVWSITGDECFETARLPISIEDMTRLCFN
jgi:hypothetical protein